MAYGFKSHHSHQKKTKSLTWSFSIKSTLTGGLDIASQYEIRLSANEIAAAEGGFDFIFCLSKIFHPKLVLDFIVNISERFHLR